MTELYKFLNYISPLKETTWTTIEPFFKLEIIEKNKFFLREGVFANKIAFLQSGILRAFYVDAKDFQYNKHFFETPSIVGGYSSLISKQLNQINIQALTECKIWVADYKLITDYYDDFPDLERLSSRMAEQYFIETEQKELEIVLFDADKRYEFFRKRFANIEQSIPQYHIASYLGISQTQLSRIRKNKT